MTDSMPASPKSHDQSVGLLLERSVNVTRSGKYPYRGFPEKFAGVVKVAKQALSAFISTCPPASQAPDHPTKVAKGSEVALSVTLPPDEKTPEQLLRQFRPVGELVTLPVPLPCMKSSRRY